MAAKTNFTLDTSQVEASLKRLVESVEPRATAQGLLAAGSQLLKDAQMIGPQAPKDTGRLWGSARVTETRVQNGLANVEAGFNIEYAAKWHEVGLGQKINWTTWKGASNPGPKYLQSKMIAYRDKYMRIIGDFLAGVLSGKAGA